LMNNMVCPVRPLPHSQSRHKVGPGRPEENVTQEIGKEEK
jgi:hypothetical protein